MERAKLEGYGLTKEQVDEIMADHGRAVNAAKEGVTALQETIANQTAQIQRYKVCTIIALEHVAEHRGGESNLLTVNRDIRFV